MILPFVVQTGATMESAASLIRKHFTQTAGTRRYRGVMQRVWRAGGWRGRVAAPFLWLASRTDMLFAETGINVPFELENTVAAGADGRVRMSWVRTFHFPGCTRRFTASMYYDPARRVIVDLLGSASQLEVELHAEVDLGAMVIQSGRQWRRLGPLRVPVPRWLRGNARVREWQVSDDMLGISVIIENSLLGGFFGYEGTFSEVMDDEADGTVLPFAIRGADPRLAAPAGTGAP